MLTPEQRRSLASRANSERALGHAALPGTGPKGETCATCKHIVRKRMSKTYLKCGLKRADWTSGSKTDIRASDPACLRFEKTARAAP